MDAAYDLITNCRCPQGCPACVGPVLENEAAQLDTKRLALAILRHLTARQQPTTPAQHIARPMPAPNLDTDISF
jgi:ATP-dependent helicase YprA (DUF1998 family)